MVVQYLESSETKNHLWLVMESKHLYFFIFKYYFGLHSSNKMPGAQRWTVAYVTSGMSPYDSQTVQGTHELERVNVLD